MKTKTIKVGKTTNEDKFYLVKNKMKTKTTNDNEHDTNPV